LPNSVDRDVHVPPGGEGVGDSHVGVDGADRFASTLVLDEKSVNAGEISGLSQLPFSSDKYGSGKVFLAEAKAS
jgi:hypothetical protein